MSFRSAATGSNLFDETVPMDKPSGLADGDVAVVALIIFDMYTINEQGDLVVPPPGFAMIGTQIIGVGDTGAVIFAKKITDASSEPATWDFLLVDSFVNIWITAAYIGDHLGNVASQGGLGTPWTAPSVLVESDGSDLLTITCAQNPVEDPTQTFRAISTNGFVAQEALLADEVINTGASGDRSGACEPVTFWCAFSVAIEAAGPALDAYQSVPFID